MKAYLTHFLVSFIDPPIVASNAPNGNHHAGSIDSMFAVHKNRLQLFRHQQWPKTAQFLYERQNPVTDGNSKIIHLILSHPFALQITSAFHRKVTMVRTPICANLSRSSWVGCPPRHNHGVTCLSLIIAALAVTAREWLRACSTSRKILAIRLTITL